MSQNPSYIFFVFPADYVWSDRWEEHNGHEYKYFGDISITAAAARQKCMDSQGMLVSINSDQEEEFIATKVLRKRTLAAFISGTDEKEGDLHIYSKCNMGHYPKNIRTMSLTTQ